MAEVNYDGITSNSNAARRAAEHEISPPAESKAVLSKPGFFRRMTDRMDVQGASSMVLEEVIFPALKDCARDAIYSITDYFLYGGSGGGGGRSSAKRGSYTEYGKKSKAKGGRRSAPSSAAYYFTYDDRASAERDLDAMRDVIDKRDFVTIMDMFAIAGKDTTNYMYNEWGWYDLRSAIVKRTSDRRYYIDLPKAVQIED